MLKIELFVGRQLIKVIRTRRLFLPKKFIFTSLALIFCASFFAFKFFTNPANAELAEINPADWRLETFFLDSEVNEGRDPIQNLVWEPEEQEYGAYQSESIYNKTRILTLQINYHNENVSRDYQPGELQIRVPTPFPADELNHATIVINEKKVGANVNDGIEYDWNYLKDAEDADSYFTFTNSTTLLTNENVEGSIQITFKLTSSLFKVMDNYEDEQVRSFTTSTAATLNGSATSNTASFSFSRAIRYDWRRARWSISLTPEKITTYTGLGDDADQYTWVVWRYQTSGYQPTGAYLNLDQHFTKYYYGLSDYSFTETLFADDVKIVQKRNDLFNTIITDIGNGDYSLENNTDTGYFVTGYPKDTYNSELGTNIVEEKVTLSGTYLKDNNGLEVLSTAKKSVNLDDYQFDPRPGLITTYKDYHLTSSTLGDDIYSQVLKKSESEIYYYISTQNRDFTGEPYDIVLGDDVIFYEDTQTGEITRLEDNYYRFGYISSISLTDFDGDGIDCSTIDISMYVRKRGSQTYEKQNNPIRCNDMTHYYLPFETVSWYLEIKNMDRPIRSFSAGGYQFVKLPEDAPNYGKYHNFMRAEVTKNGERVNVKTLDDYADDSLKSYISDYDIETYGSYQHRASASQEWTYYQLPDKIYRSYSAWVDANTPEYKPSIDAFYGTANVSSWLDDYNYTSGIGAWGVAADQFSERYLHDHAEFSFIAPKGVIIESTEEEIAQSFTNRYSYDIYSPFKDKTAKNIFGSRSDFESFIRNHTTVTITKNWQGTGRYYIKIEIDFSERPFTTFNRATDRYGRSPATVANYFIKYSIPYDVYRENGLNYTFAFTVSDDKEELGESELERTPKDGPRETLDGLYDLDDDGRTDDNVWIGTKNITLLPVASSHQNIQTSIYSADDNEYSLDDTIIEPGEEYTYKLRLRNSTNRITNTVIYSELEEAYEDNPHWNGDFQGVDTSFAESQLDNYGNPVQVKVYWSAKASVGKLSEDDSWQEYDETTTDKTQVKSLAFQYLDQNGAPAILPQSNYSYVLVKMKAPDDDSISTYAYNKCFSEWNPIDNLSGEVQPLLTGIESNVVRAYFSEEIEAHAKKVWDDQDNKYGLRPRSITFYLYDGDELINEGEIDVENLEDSLDFLNLDITKRANYRIEIDPIEGYDTSLDIDLDTLTFTFTSKIILPDEPEEETPSDEGSDAPTTHDSVMFYVMFATVMSTAAFVAMLRQTRR